MHVQHQCTKNLYAVSLVSKNIILSQSLVTCTERERERERERYGDLKIYRTYVLSSIDLDIRYMYIILLR